MVSPESRRRSFFDRLLRRSERPGRDRGRRAISSRPTDYAPDDGGLATAEPIGAGGPEPGSPEPAAPVLLRAEGATTLRGIASGTCPKCHVPYLPAGTTGRWGCPFCGRHATTVGVPAASSSASLRPRPDRPGEQRHEELLAAWMIGGPLPCPHCRASLRHTSGGEFACPACGERTQLDELGPAPPGAGPSALR